MKHARGEGRIRLWWWILVRDKIAPLELRLVCFTSIKLAPVPVMHFFSLFPLSSFFSICLNLTFTDSKNASTE